MCMRLRTSKSRVELVAMTVVAMFFLMSRVVDTGWPLFTFRARGSTRGGSSNQNLVDGFLLVAWSVATTLKRRFENAEKRMRSLAYLTIMDDQERFTQLIDFRCDIWNCYDDLKLSKNVVNSFLERSTLKAPFTKRDYDGALDLQQREDAK